MRSQRASLSRIVVLVVGCAIETTVDHATYEVWS